MQLVLQRLNPDFFSLEVRIRVNSTRIRNPVTGEPDGILINRGTGASEEDFGIWMLTG